MLAETSFSFARASPLQQIAFIGFAIATVAFFVWLALLARRK
jgi:hypothetical protein